MGWKIVEIWKNHTFPRGELKGETHLAFPKWNDERQGFDVYPPDDNVIDQSELCPSLDELYISLGRGWRVRCTVPTTGHTSILTGPFQARFESF